MFGLTVSILICTYLSVSLWAQKPPIQGKTDASNPIDILASDVFTPGKNYFDKAYHFFDSARYDSASKIDVDGVLDMENVPDQLNAGVLHPNHNPNDFQNTIAMKILMIFAIITLNVMNSFSQTPKKAEIVPLNGTAIYYEVYGKGAPLFLLHGYTQSSQSWLPYVADYANEFQVYLVDLKGHGKSSPFTENLSIKAAASDVDALIKYLQLNSINAIGFSYGGDILFQLALLHPGLIKSMITIGSCGTWHIKEFPHWMEFLSYKNIDNLPWMREQQTSEEQIRPILDQMPNYDVSVSDEEMKNIQAKTLIVVGDQDDSIPLAYIASARKNLPHSFLWILPNTGHVAHKDKNKSEFVRLSKEFLSQRWSK